VILTLSRHDIAYWNLTDLNLAHAARVQRWCPFFFFDVSNLTTKKTFTGEIIWVYNNSIDAPSHHDHRQRIKTGDNNAVFFFFY
jgi:hypothetical protein